MNHMMGGKRSNTFDVIAQHERKSDVSRPGGSRGGWGGAEGETFPAWVTGDAVKRFY